MAVHELNHPLVKHKIGLMRKADLSTKAFRELAQEITILLAYEATRHMPLESTTIEGWAGPVEVEKIAGKKVTVVPILRAGLGMLDGILSLVPSAKVSVLGIARDEETLLAKVYLQKLVSGMSERQAFIIDPMLATGGSMLSTIECLKDAGCRSVTALVLVAAPRGLEAVQQAHPDVDIYTASIDEKLDENGYIVPGLGDAGDRIFGTR